MRGHFQRGQGAYRFSVIQQFCSFPLGRLIQILSPFELKRTQISAPIRHSCSLYLCNVPQSAV